MRLIHNHRGNDKDSGPSRGSSEGAKTLGTSGLLAAAGGFLDAFTYVGHGHVFANAMTGNVVLLGINCISGSWQTGLRHLPPILTFLVGVSAAKALQLPALQRRVRDPYMVVLLLEISGLLAVSLLPAGTADLWFTISIAFVASLQIQTFREVNGHSYNSTFTTGNLRTLSEASFDWFFGGRGAESARVVRDFALICAAFLAGATAGGFATARFGSHALWIAVGLLLVVVLRVRSGPKKFGSNR